MPDTTTAAAICADILDPPGIADVFATLGYRPDPPQAAFHAATEFDVGYGGQLGGGKTVALTMDGIKAAVAYPGIRIGGFRRTYDELAESFFAVLAKFDYGRAVGAHWNGSDRELRFPNGSVIRFRYAETVPDATRRQGGEYQLMLIDERQLVDPAVVDYLETRIRSGAPGVPILGIRSAFNPGGIGHALLKERYVDRTRHGAETYEDVVDGVATGKLVRFIPAPPSPHLDAGYDARLAGIADPELRRAMREGDWDVFGGQAFPEWRRKIHVVDPDEMPLPLGGVLRGCGVDYGIAQPWCALWGAVLADELIVVYREAYETNLTPSEQAARIIALEAKGERVPGRPLPVWLDPSCWIRQPDSPKPMSPGAAPAKSIASDYAKAGVAVHRGYNDRLGGKRLVHDKLRLQGDGRPRLVVYSTCTNLIRTLPALPRSPIRPEDVDTKAEDHAYDALRYLLGGLLGRAVDKNPSATPAKTTAGTIRRAGF